MGSARWAQPQSDGRRSQWARGKRRGGRGGGGGRGRGRSARDARTRRAGGGLTLSAQRSGLTRAVNTARRRRRPRRGSWRAGGVGARRPLVTAALGTAPRVAVLPRRPPSPPLSPPSPPSSRPPRGWERNFPKVSAGRRTTTWRPLRPSRGRHGAGRSRLGPGGGGRWRRGGSAGAVPEEGASGRPREPLPLSAGSRGRGAELRAVLVSARAGRCRAGGRRRRHGAVQPRSPSASGTGSGGRGLSAPATAGRRRSLGCVSPQRPEVLFGAGPRGEVDPVLRSRAKPMLRFVLTTRSSRARGTCYVSLWGKRRAYMHWSRCSRHGLTPGKRHLNLFGSPQLGTICSLTGVFWH